MLARMLDDVDAAPLDGRGGERGGGGGEQEHAGCLKDGEGVRREGGSERGPGGKDGAKEAGGTEQKEQAGPRLDFLL